jgi:hypothetical protein
MGMVSSGAGGDVFFWDIINFKETNRILDKDFTLKNVSIGTVVNIPGRKHEIFCAGNDSKIWNNNLAKDPFEV